MLLVKRNVYTQINRLKECIACAKQGKRTRIQKESLEHPNDLGYNRHYLMISKLCEDCFGKKDFYGDLNHLNNDKKSQIQCKNWGIEKDCLRYFHIKSVRVLAKLRGEPYIEKNPISPKTLIQKGLCFRCYD